MFPPELGGNSYSDSATPDKMSLEVPQKRGESPLNLQQQVEWCWQNWYTPPAPLVKGGVGDGEALVLVGRYLAEDPDLSLAQMLARLKAQGVQDEAIDLDEQQMQDTFSTAQRGVRAAFELSWQELEPLTRRIAEYLSLFAPTVFLWEWIASDTELFNCSKSDINAAKKRLYKLHLIEQIKEQEGGYKIHPIPS